VNNPRLYAVKTLQAVIDNGRSLDTLLFDVSSAITDERDQSLAKALVYGVLRHYYRLDELAGRLLKQPFKQKDRDVLMLILLGLFQLQYHRAPGYAVVSESVGAAAALGKAWAKGLVNAVLRNFLRQHEQLAKQPPKSDLSRYNAPDWIISRLRQDWPEDWLMLLQANQEQAPMTLRVNRNRIVPRDYLKQLAGAGLTGSPVEGRPEAVQLDTACEVERLPGFREGLVSVQDAAAQWAAPLLEPQAGDRVLDACAAPGGKTGHLLEYQPDIAELWALEVDAVRAEKISDTLQRLGFTGYPVTLRVADAVELDSWWDGRCFDRILLDAPCSATGVIRRHPDIPFLRREADIPVLAETQNRLLRALWRTLAPGGMLLYCTCSVFQEENERQINGFLGVTPDAAALPISLPQSVSCATGTQILSGSLGRDGFYYAGLIKAR